MNSFLSPDRVGELTAYERVVNMFEIKQVQNETRIMAFSWVLLRLICESCACFWCCLEFS